MRTEGGIFIVKADLVLLSAQSGDYSSARQLYGSVAYKGLPHSWGNVLSQRKTSP